MKAKEYLQQAFRLNQKINFDIQEEAELRQMITSISAIRMTEKVQSSGNGEAPYIKGLEKLIEMEKKINREIDQLVDLKEEIREVIEALADPNEKLVLLYRYLQGCTWKQIGQELNVDQRTVRRWHASALQHVVIPEKF